MRLIEPNDWDTLTPTEAALLARCSPKDVSTACENGALKAENRGKVSTNFWRVQWCDLRQWIADGRPIEPTRVA